MKLALLATLSILALGVSAEKSLADIAGLDAHPERTDRLMAGLDRGFDADHRGNLRESTMRKHFEHGQRIGAIPKDAEFEDFYGSLVSAADQDGDGRVSSDEMHALAREGLRRATSSRIKAFSRDNEPDIAPFKAASSIAKSSRPADCTAKHFSPKSAAEALSTFDVNTIYSCPDAPSTTELTTRHHLQKRGFLSVIGWTLGLVVLAPILLLIVLPVFLIIAVVSAPVWLPILLIYWIVSMFTSD
jgi:hypothetical protein